MILSEGRGDGVQRGGRAKKRLFVNSSNRNIKEFYVFRGGRLLNMVLKDMSNKTGSAVVPASQIKNNRRRKRGDANLEAWNLAGGVTFSDQLFKALVKPAHPNSFFIFKTHVFDAFSSQRREAGVEIHAFSVLPCGLTLYDTSGPVSLNQLP